MRIVFIRLIMGMMLTSSFLSMWLSNTATTAMMLPIANAILESLYGDLETLKENCKSTNDPERDIINGLLNVVYQTWSMEHGIFILVHQLLVCSPVSLKSSSHV